MNTILTAIAVTILDQVVKWFVQGHMELGESIPLISHVFHLTYIMNPGAAFGILEYQHTFFIGIVVILFAAYLIMRRRIPKNPVYFPIGIGMVLGGWGMPLTGCGIRALSIFLIFGCGLFLMWLTLPFVWAWH